MVETIVTSMLPAPSQAQGTTRYSWANMPKSSRAARQVDQDADLSMPVFPANHLEPSSEVPIGWRNRCAFVDRPTHQSQNDPARPDAGQAQRTLAGTRQALTATSVDGPPNMLALALFTGVRE